MGRAVRGRHNGPSIRGGRRMTEATHAVLSPSGAHRWMRCPGSVAMEAPFPRDDNAYSREGTAAHTLAQMTFESSSRKAAAFLGRILEVDGHSIEVKQEMVDAVQTYVDNVLQYAGSNPLLIEQRVPIGHVTGEKDGKGTADAIVIEPKTLQIHDLKYGRGVEVSPEENEQEMLYGLGGLEMLDLLGDFEDVLLVIHQPRVSSAPLEWRVSVADLKAFAVKVCDAADTAGKATIVSEIGGNIEPHLVPGEKQCRFCKARAVCPALAKKVVDDVGADFEVLATVDEHPERKEQLLEVNVPNLTPDELGVKMSAIDLIETWCKAIRAEVERRLLHGDEVAGYKLVQGRMGSRAWGDKSAAEAALKAMRLTVDEMYDKEIKSPTQIEKVLKGKPKRWTKIEPLIVRSEGKPSVAPESDKRPALTMTPTADEFEDLTK